MHSHSLQTFSKKQANLDQLEDEVFASEWPALTLLANLPEKFIKIEGCQLVEYPRWATEEKRAGPL